MTANTAIALRPLMSFLNFFSSLFLIELFMLDIGVSGGGGKFKT